MDDALDYVADESEFGKATGHDLHEGKMTLPLIHALKRSSPEERSRVAEIVEQEDLPESDLAYVLALIDRYDGIDYTRRRAGELVMQSADYLRQFPDGVEKEALFELAEYVVSRRK